MPKYSVGMAVRVWLETEVVTSNEEKAREVARKRADALMNSGKFCWLGGEHEVVGITNMTLLNKIPM